MPRRRCVRAMSGLALIALSSLAAPANASGQEVADRVGESSRAGGPDSGNPLAATDASSPESGRQGRVARLLSRGQDRAQPRPAVTRRLRGFLQGGMYFCCEGRGGGFAFGGGGGLALSRGFRLFADGHLIDPGYRTALYGSGTLAYQFGGRAGNSVEPLVGIGLGGASEGGVGEQFVVGLGSGRGFGQVRVVRLGRNETLVLLLGGVSF